jgi:hypothetical protein
MSGFLFLCIALVLMVLIVFAVVVYGIGIYNNLIQVPNNIDKSFNNIDTLLFLRYEERSEKV